LFEGCCHIANKLELLAVNGDIELHSHPSLRSKVVVSQATHVGGVLSDKQLYRRSMKEASQGDLVLGQFLATESFGLHEPREPKRANRT
jgi:hypothetical protein